MTTMSKYRGINKTSIELIDLYVKPIEIYIYIYIYIGNGKPKQ